MSTVESQVSSRGAGAGVSVGVVSEARGAAEALGGTVDASLAGRAAGLAEEGAGTLAQDGSSRASASTIEVVDGVKRTTVTLSRAGT